MDYQCQANLKSHYNNHIQKLNEIHVRICQREVPNLQGRQNKQKKLRYRKSTWLEKKQGRNQKAAQERPETRGRKIKDKQSDR